MRNNIPTATIRGMNVVKRVMFTLKQYLEIRRKMVVQKPTPKKLKSNENFELLIF
jgi:hypothetical protein